MRNKYDLKKLQKWINKNEETYNGKYSRTEAEEVILNNFGVMRIKDKRLGTRLISYADIRNMFLLKGGD